MIRVQSVYSFGCIYLAFLFAFGCDTPSSSTQVELDLKSCIPSQSTCEGELQDQLNQGCYLIQHLDLDGKVDRQSTLPFRYENDELLFTGSPSLPIQQGESFRGLRITNFRRISIKKARLAQINAIEAGTPKRPS